MYVHNINKYVFIVYSIKKWYLIHNITENELSSILLKKYCIIPNISGYSKYKM